MWIMNREDHLNVSGGVENVVSKTNDGIFCFVICGVLGYQLMVGLQAASLRTGRARCVVLRLGWTTVAVVVRLARTVGCIQYRQRTCACTPLVVWFSG